MAKGIRERLLEQAIKFHQWQEATYPGKTSEEIGGEWEVDYPYWNDTYSAFCQVLTQMDAETADSVLLDEMVYLIARDNEAEGFIQETTSHPQWFECLCRRAAASNESEAKWQFAAYLPECPCSQEIKDMILDFAKDPNEYVSRRALLAMPALRPDCVEQFAPLFWERNCYEKALALDLTILPWLEEWYYSNVSDEHMIAMTVAAIQLHREQELIEALTKEQARIRAENGLPQRDRFCDILMDYLKRGVMPFADNDKNYPYHEPEEPQTKEQLWAKLVEQNKKLSPDDPDARRKLYNHCCMFGTARDAVDLFEEIQGVPMADSSYRDAIARYLYLGEREKALQTAERLATSRLWAVAGPTQVRPMSFFEDPNLREFLLEPESLRRIREAALIDNGTLTRK